MLSGGDSERSASSAAIVVLILTLFLCLAATLISYSYLNGLLPPAYAEKVHRGITYFSGLLGFKEQKLDFSKLWK